MVTQERVVVVVLAVGVVVETAAAPTTVTSVKPMRQRFKSGRSDVARWNSDNVEIGRNRCIKFLLNSSIIA